MSIIHDALKKTQSNLAKTDQPQPSPKKEDPNKKIIKPLDISSEQKPPPLPSKSKGKKYFFLSLIFFLLIVVSLPLWKTVKFPTKTIPTAIDNISPTKILQSISLPEIKKPTETNLILSGTMMMDSKRVALINNEIYELGEYINGMKIININLKKVDLLNKDDIITLHVRQYAAP